MPLHRRLVYRTPVLALAGSLGDSSWLRSRVLRQQDLQPCQHTLFVAIPECHLHFVTADGQVDITGTRGLWEGRATARCHSCAIRRWGQQLVRLPDQPRRQSMLTEMFGRVLPIAARAGALDNAVVPGRITGTVHGGGPIVVQLDILQQG